MEIFLGVDPGITGGFAVIQVPAGGDPVLIELKPMPVYIETLATGKTRKRTDPAGVAAFLKDWTCATRLAIELVAARPGQSAQSVFALGSAFGVLTGVAAALAIPVILPRPQVWKPLAGIATGLDRQAGKDASRSRAAALWPSFHNVFKLKKSDGLSDAALIALAGYLSA